MPKDHANRADTVSVSELSTAQGRAFTDIMRWTDRPAKPTFGLFGVAGAGKTTLIKLVVGQFHPEQVAVMAPTGKAAHVLRRKGCENAGTIHSWIYSLSPEELKKHSDLKAEFRKERDPLRREHLRKAILQEEARLRDLRFRVNPMRLQGYKLIIVDEASMVGEKIGRDLLRCQVPVLVVMDPAQLPPPFEDQDRGFFDLDEPDFFLDEVVRQALDNPIIKLATEIRHGRMPAPGIFDGSTFLQRNHAMSPDVFARCDQILTHRHDTRIMINHAARRRLGFGDPLPVVGDRLVCRQNTQGEGPIIDLFNGSIWIVDEVVSRLIEADVVDPYHSDHREPFTATVLRIHADYDPAITTTVTCLVQPFVGLDKEGQLIDPLVLRLSNCKVFDYGYALTVHSAQGSEWDNVAIVNEYARSDWSRWLYTAVTRAIEQVHVVKYGVAFAERAEHMERVQAAAAARQAKWHEQQPPAADVPF